MTPLPHGVSDNLIDHLKENFLCRDYNDYMRFCAEYSAIGVEISEDRIPDPLHAKAALNIKNAAQRVSDRLELTQPKIGDFVRCDNTYYRLATKISETAFQYCCDGSFFMNKGGHCSYSGGFDFTHGVSFETTSLHPTDELKQGSFWFFSQDWAEGNNGVHFKGNFKVWEVFN